MKAQSEKKFMLSAAVKYDNAMGQNRERQISIAAHKAFDHAHRKPDGKLCVCVWW
jgi:hypothetical protein